MLNGNNQSSVRRVSVAALGAGLSLIGASVHAGLVHVTVSGTTSPGPSQALVAVDSMLVPIPLPPAATATMVRNAMMAGLSGALIDATASGTNSLDVVCDHNLAMLQPNPLWQVRMTSTHMQFGYVEYFGHFESMNHLRQPAIFTAGIVTDVGELSASVTAQELNFQTDGPIICQALFQRLVPRAPQYGAQINYAGDRLEVYFDPAYTVTQGGIIFGTTSQTPGAGGGVVLSPQQPRCVADVDDGTGTGTPDGGVTIEDLIYYLFLFDQGDARADVDDGSGTGTLDGGVSIEDLLYYLERFDRGC